MWRKSVGILYAVVSVGGVSTVIHFLTLSTIWTLTGYFHLLRVRE